MAFKDCPHYLKFIRCFICMNLQSNIHFLHFHYQHVIMGRIKSACWQHFLLWCGNDIQFAKCVGVQFCRVELLMWLLCLAVGGYETIICSSIYYLVLLFREFHLCTQPWRNSYRWWMGGGSQWWWRLSVVLFVGTRPFTIQNRSRFHCEVTANVCVYKSSFFIVIWQITV